MTRVSVCYLICIIGVSCNRLHHSTTAVRHNSHPHIVTVLHSSLTALLVESCIGRGLKLVKSNI